MARMTENILHISCDLADKNTRTGCDDPVSGMALDPASSITGVPEEGEPFTWDVPNAMSAFIIDGSSFNQGCRIDSNSMGNFSKGTLLYYFCGNISTAITSSNNKISLTHFESFSNTIFDIQRTFGDTQTAIKLSPNSILASGPSITPGSGGGDMAAVVLNGADSMEVWNGGKFSGVCRLNFGEDKFTFFRGDGTVFESNKTERGIRYDSLDMGDPFDFPSSPTGPYKLIPIIRGCDLFIWGVYIFPDGGPNDAALIKFAQHLDVQPRLGNKAPYEFTIQEFDMKYREATARSVSGNEVIGMTKETSTGVFEDGKLALNSLFNTPIWMPKAVAGVSQVALSLGATSYGGGTQFNAGSFGAAWIVVPFILPFEGMTVTQGSVWASNDIDAAVNKVELALYDATTLNLISDLGVATANVIAGVPTEKKSPLVSVVVNTRYVYLAICGFIDGDQATAKKLTFAGLSNPLLGNNFYPVSDPLNLAASTRAQEFAQPSNGAIPPATIPVEAHNAAVIDQPVHALIYLDSPSI